MEKWIEVEDDPEVPASIELQVLDNICSELDEAAVQQPGGGGGNGDDDDDNGLEKLPVKHTALLVNSLPNSYGCVHTSNYS